MKEKGDENLWLAESLALPNPARCKNPQATISGGDQLLARQLVGAGGILVLLAMGAWWLYGNAEGKIRVTLKAGADAVVRHDFLSAIRVLSPNYRDGGGLTFRDLQRMLLDWCRNKRNQLWLQQFTVEQVALIDFWRAAALVKVQGIVSVEGFGSIGFGPVTLSVRLERTWWGRWRITSLDGWQDEPNIQQFLAE